MSLTSEKVWLFAMRRIGTKRRFFDGVFEPSKKLARVALRKHIGRDAHRPLFEPRRYSVTLSDLPEKHQHFLKAKRVWVQNNDFYNGYVVWIGKLRYVNVFKAKQDADAKADELRQLLESE